MSDKAISVTQLNLYIKALVDCDDFLSSLVVRGEVSNLTYHRSGHIYFTLKDENSVIKAVMFRSYAQRLNFELKEGMKIIAYGKVDIYSQGGQYQLVTTALQPDGKGELYMQFEQIKEKLEKEGLFDDSRKKPLPQYPENIGIVTSPTGAVIHDLIKNIRRRYKNVNIVLYPSLVQGDGAVEKLIAGLEYFNATASVDVIIIGRGGGSIEDLWAFNSEELALTISKSKIPVISAVGHESDFTICDFVADKRASTPTGAAELAVPDSGEIKIRFAEILKRLVTSVTTKVRTDKQYLSALSKRRVLVSKESILDGMRIKIDKLSDELDFGIDKKIKQSQNNFDVLYARLNTLSPLNTLKRGYAITEDKDGNVIESVAKIKEEDKMKIVFADGYADVTVDGTHKKQGENHGTKETNL